MAACAARGASVVAIMLFAAAHAQAKKQLGWEPKVALREGLSMMVNDFAKRLGVPVPEAPGRK